MYLAASLVLALLFALGLNRSISKYPIAWYVASTLLTMGVWLYYLLGFRDVFPEGFTTYFVNPFKRGAFSTALFILVMYVGVLNPKWTITKKLRNIRGELSIIACIITLGHNLVYGKNHFVKLFTRVGEMKIQYLIATIISLVMIVIMLPLMITSFRCVRGRMKAATWKGIQRWAYVFFALIYFHVMVVFVTKASKKWVDIIVYTIIFGGYFLLKADKINRIRKVK